ncbi:hypothetical protein [Vibrio phage vB_ValA_R15Z]|uniref:Uncharacterized protein n=1 Tax=Vibrio phage vB_ValA_R15Z TaxID=3044218 RepID=A0AA49X7H2_9CAUD|nr:hypothetical protein [Vibrio phage vB_ValA_R15Z]
MILFLFILLSSCEVSINDEWLLPLVIGETGYHPNHWLHDI